MWALLSFLGSLLAGLVLCPWGLHSSHLVMGPALFEAGVVLTNAGVLITLLATYHNLGGCHVDGEACFSEVNSRLLDA